MHLPMPADSQDEPIIYHSREHRLSVSQISAEFFKILNKPKGEKSEKHNGKLKTARTQNGQENQGPR